MFAASWAQTIFDDHWISLVSLRGVALIVMALGGLAIWWTWPRPRSTEGTPPVAGEFQVWDLCRAGVWLLPALLAGGWLTLNVIPHLRPLVVVLDQGSTLATAASPVQPLAGAIGTLPSWVTSPPTGTDTVVLASHIAATPQEAETEILIQVEQVVQREFHHTHAWAGGWTVPRTDLKQRLITHQYLERQPQQIGRHQESLYRLHAQVNVSQTMLATLEPVWRRDIVTQRLGLIGVVIAWCWFSLAAWAGYFWIRQRLPTKHWWMAKLASVQVPVVAAGILCTYWL